MTVEITTVGGYDLVGGNMTAIKVGDEVVIFDIGLNMEPYIKLTDDEDIEKVDEKLLTKVGAIPDIGPIEDWADKVVGICPSHAHLDHIGAIPHLAHHFNAPVCGTPFTIEVLNTILKSEEINLNNEVRIVPVNGKTKLSDNITVEFISATHSTPDSSMVAIHTPEGVIIYACDFKVDRFPTFGKKMNFKRLEELGKKGVLALICESTYAWYQAKTPSESVAKEMLKDVLLGHTHGNEAVLVTTFASHIARLKSLIELGKKMDRKVLLLGRSFKRYLEAAKNANLIDLFEGVEVVTYKSHIKRKLKQVSKDGKNRYLLIVTGHQGEPKATLSKMANGDFEFDLEAKDHVVFSCKIIPTPTNLKNRKQLEHQLERHRVHIFKDVHASGHAAREDLREILQLINPKHIIPAHGGERMRNELGTLAREIGYKDKNIHLLDNGKRAKLDP